MLIDFAGVFAGALAGALETKQNREYQFDFVGVIGLGLISALGGGITRDILLQHGPPLAFTDVRYLLIAFAGAMVGLLCGATIHQRIGKLLLWVDAAALGLFAVAGSTRALAAGLTFLPALVLGIVTAVGGGSLRDVFSGRTPKVFERGEPYALVAAIVSVLFIALDRGTGNDRLATSIGVATGFTIRALALRYQWRTKAARTAV
ncbi:MAG TPA: TRIC cation channel family protein [Bryobacteraceae bacterium]